MTSRVGVEYSPFYSVSAVGAEEESRPEIGAIALKGIDLVQSSSFFVRSVIGTLNTVEQRENPISFSALGLTSVFSIISSTLSFQEGWKESALMKRIGDRVGGIFANLKVIRTGLQTTAAALFVPVRALSIAAYATASKSLALVSDLLGKVGGSIFGAAGFIMGISKAIEVYEVLSFTRELNAVHESCAGTDREKAAACFRFLQQQLQLSSKEELEIFCSVEKDSTLCSPVERREKIQELKNALTDKKRSVLERLISKECLADLESASFKNMEEIIQKVFRENGKIVCISAVMLMLCLAGVVGATVLPWIGGSQTVDIAASVINAFLAAVGFGMDIYQFQAAFAKNMPGRWDFSLLSVFSFLCVGSVSLSAILEEGAVLHAVTGCLGILWLIINLLCFLRLKQAEQALAETSAQECVSPSLDSFDHILA